MVIIRINSSIIFDKKTFYEVVNHKNQKFLAEEAEITPASLVRRYKAAHPTPIKAWEIDEILNIDINSCMVLVKWKPSPPGPGKPIKKWKNSEIYFGNLYCPKLIEEFQEKCRPSVANKIEKMIEEMGH
uniref:Uncharacterized protein n=1 Tax=Panagrolaimus sp. ES5 TaxID=591445 RepID=A0AC34FCR0_9BILA